MWHFEILLKSGHTITVVKPESEKDKFFQDLQAFMGVLPNNAKRLTDSITVSSADGSFSIINLDSIDGVDIYKGKEPVTKAYQKKGIDKSEGKDILLG
jgi:hypothetical protein